MFSVLVGVFPLPLRATLTHSSKRSYSPLLKRAVVLRNRRVGERRLESSRLVCPGIRFLPINWDWQGSSVAGSLAPGSGCALAGARRSRVMLAATRVPWGRNRRMRRGPAASPARRSRVLARVPCGQVSFSALLFSFYTTARLLSQH